MGYRLQNSASQSALSLGCTTNKLFVTLVASTVNVERIHSHISFYLLTWTINITYVAQKI